MKTSISFNPNEAVINTAKPNKPNSTQAIQNSFSHFLSKEISGQKNTPADNVSDKLKNKISNASAKNEAPKSTESNADQVKKQDESEKDTTVPEKDASGAGQLLTFVENLGQFNLKPESSSEVKDPSVEGLDQTERQLPESTTPINKGADSGQQDEANGFASKIVQSINDGLQTDDKKGKADTTSKTQLDTSVPTPLNRPANLLNNTVDAKAENKSSSTELSQDLAIATPPVTAQPQNFIQQLSANTPPPTASVATDHLSPRLGTNAWNQAVGQKIVWMVGGGQQTAELSLNPPDLGPLQVVISVNNDQASANFFAAQPDVREALEAALPRLRQMMSEAGVQLSGFSVNAQASNQGDQSSGNHQQTRRQNNSATNSVEAPISNLASGTTRIVSKDGLVDTFA